MTSYSFGFYMCTCAGIDMIKKFDDYIMDMYPENELLEMAACGNTHGLYLVIWTNDGGWIPHFHVFNNPNPKKAAFDACLKLETPEYFAHGGHTDILNKKQVKHIIELLKSEKRPGLTWWEYLIDTWNSNNSQAEIPYDMEMPDYSTLND